MSALVNTALLAVIGIAVGLAGAATAGLLRTQWAKPVGIGLLVLGVIAEGVAVARPHHAEADLGVTASTPSFIVTPATPVSVPPTTSSSSPLPVPSVLHPHLLDLIRYATGTAPGPQARVINREWVRLRNPRPTSITLTGWHMKTATGAVYTFPSFALPAGATVTIHTGAGTNSSTSLYWGLSTFVLSDYSGTITLTNAQGVVQNVSHYQHAPGGLGQSSC